MSLKALGCHDENNHLKFISDMECGSCHDVPYQLFGRRDELFPEVYQSILWPTRLDVPIPSSEYRIECEICGGDIKRA